MEVSEMDVRGIVLRQYDDETAPVIVCELCGEVVRDYRLAWAMWPSLLAQGQTVKPVFLCKANQCVSKPPYRDFASMELGSYLIDLCRNMGMKSVADFREALELSEIGDRI
jgi:hypothetical protein